MKLLICTQVVDKNDPILGFFHRWIREFAQQCEQVTIICLREGEHELPDNVTILPLQNRRRLARAFEVIWLSVARRDAYDAVFVHMNPEYVDVAGWLWRLMGKRIVLWYTHKSTPWTLRLAMPFVHTVLTASRESFRITSPKVIITGHGIDTERPVPQRQPSSGPARLISTGRIAPVKGVDVMVDAFLELVASTDAESFVMYGKPSSDEDEAYKQVLEERLRAAGQDPATVFPGSVPHDELPAKRAHTDYLLHASETGSLDKNVLNACMSGVIPISSSEAYDDLFEGYRELLQYPKADAAALAGRVRALQALPEERREEIRKALKERVIREHSLSALIGKIMSTLES